MTSDKRLGDIADGYQLIIIGGGIYGASICWEAAHRGINVLLVERDDYACGASSNSMKTIHGGLRALQRMDFRAVMRGIRERGVWETIAPNYVRKLPCVMPMRGVAKSKPVVSGGLLIYNVLQRALGRSAVRGLNSHVIPFQKFSSLFPQVNCAGCAGAALWYDAQVENTERLVLQFIQSAIACGATALNHTEASSFLADSRSAEVQLTDHISGERKSVKADIVIDSSSVWQFAQKYLNQGGNETRFVKAVNIVIHKKLFDAALGISSVSHGSRASRLYFFSPWRQYTLVGTWYYDACDCFDYTVCEAEVHECVRQANRALGQPLLKTADVCNVHVGYLPAFYTGSTEGDPSSKLLNHYSLTHGDVNNRLYALYGTKYTNARFDAVKVINNVASKAGWIISSSLSHKLSVYRNDNVADYHIDIPLDILNRINRDYGVNTHRVMDLAMRSSKMRGVIPGCSSHIVAEIDYVVIYEQALTLCDLLKRRLDIGAGEPPSVTTANYCALRLQKLLGWTNERRSDEIRRLYKTYPDFVLENCGIQY